MVFDPNLQIDWRVDGPGNATPNSALLIRQEFENVYNSIRNIEPVGKVDTFDDDTSPSDSWFDLCSPSSEILSTYSGANPDTTGWPALVTYWRNKKVKEPLTVDSNGIPTGPKHFEFEVKDIRLEEISGQRHFSLQLEDSGNMADMNGRITNAIVEHHLATGRYPQLHLSRDIIIGGTTIPSGEYAISRIDTTNMKFSVVFNYGSESVLSESFTSNKPTLAFYSHRIAGQTTKAWHYCRAGMAIVGAGGQKYSGGLVRRDHFQGWKPIGSGNILRTHPSNPLAASGSGIRGVANAQGFHNDGVYSSSSNPNRPDKWTQMLGMGIYLYIYGGRKLTS